MGCLRPRRATPVGLCPPSVSRRGHSTTLSGVSLLQGASMIFVSIDDNEVHHLRMMLDEVFGELNFVANMVWQKKYAASNDAKGIATMHDHILVYAKSGSFERNLLPRTEKQNAAYRFDDGDGKGPWRSDNLLVKSFSESYVFPITNPQTGKKYMPSKGSCWRGSRETIERWLKEKRIFFGKIGKGAPQLKRYLNEVQAGSVPTSWLPFEVAGHNDEANKEVHKIFDGKCPFETPKPSRLIKALLQIASGSKEPDVILDSYAGSGTTAHAVLALNKEDGGNRKFILVQMSYDTKEQEKKRFNICEKVAAERVRRVIEGYSFKKSNGEKEKVGGLGGGFSYVRLGEPLFGAYRNFVAKLPRFEELAKYIFHTETSHDFDAKALDEKSGRIGQHAGTAYYLLYTAKGDEAQSLDLAWLKAVDRTETCRNLVVYCEKLCVHRDDLAAFEKSAKRTVRPMLVPFQLK
ncbi:MAG: site-specific DNA-methyltransferase [Planctomycetota bacterium]